MKINYGLLLGAALVATSALADQATYDALTAAGIPLSSEHERKLLAAEGTELIGVVAAIQSAHADSIVEITAVAVAAGAVPAHAAAYAAEAVALAPQHAEAISAVTIEAAPHFAEVILAVLTQNTQRVGVVAPVASGIGQHWSIPSGGGGGAAVSRN